MSVRGVLQFGRIHSTPITFSLLLISYILAYGSVTPLQILIIFLISIPAHWVAFGWNGYFDWERDVRDPNKQHFEYFSDNKTHYLIALSILTFVVGFIVVSFSVNKYVSTIAIVLAIISGILYDICGKLKMYGPLFSGMANAAFIFFFGGTTFNAILLAIFLFISSSIRDGYTGGLKDKEMWYNVEPSAFITIILLFTVYAIFVIFAVAGSSYYTLLPILLYMISAYYSLFMTFLHHAMLSGVPVSRARVVKTAVLREMFEKFALVSLFGWPVFILYVTISLIWLSCMNVLLWGGLNVRV